jgi:hypothetical protein
MGRLPFLKCLVSGFPLRSMVSEFILAFNSCRFVSDMFQSSGLCWKGGLSGTKAGLAHVHTAICILTDFHGPVLAPTYKIMII